MVFAPAGSRFGLDRPARCAILELTHRCETGTGCCIGSNSPCQVHSNSIAAAIGACRTFRPGIWLTTATDFLAPLVPAERFRGRAIHVEHACKEFLCQRH